jgi:hypothetical protein
MRSCYAESLQIAPRIGGELCNIFKKSVHIEVKFSEMTDFDFKI